MKTTHELVIKIKVRNSQLEDILESAFTGCTYWADDVFCPIQELSETRNLTLAEALTRGYYLLIRDIEEHKWEKLTLKKFLKGLKLTPGFDYDNYDNLDAEQVLQKALFGKVIYG